MEVVSTQARAGREWFHEQPSWVKILIFATLGFGGYQLHKNRKKKKKKKNRSWRANKAEVLYRISCLLRII